MPEDDDPLGLEDAWATLRPKRAFEAKPKKAEPAWVGVMDEHGHECTARLGCKRLPVQLTLDGQPFVVEFAVQSPHHVTVEGAGIWFTETDGEPFYAHTLPRVHVAVGDILRIDLMITDVGGLMTRVFTVLGLLPATTPP